MVTAQLLTSERGETRISLLVGLTCEQATRLSREKEDIRLPVEAAEYGEIVLVLGANEAELKRKLAAYGEQMSVN